VRPHANTAGSASEPGVLVVLGSTATGKTAASVTVAKQIEGEIISADSRAFFAGLDIVTARPTLEEQSSIPHHGLGIVPWTLSYDAMAFRRDVSRWVLEIVGRNRVPMLVGGGTLYVGAVLRGLFEGPSRSEVLRSQMAQQAMDTLYGRLLAVDPEAARSIHPNDRLRVERALEVFATTGQPISALQPLAEPLPFRFTVVGLRRERTEHRAAIVSRTRRMIDTGLLDEVRTLLAAGLSPQHQAYRTIGIPEMAAVIDGRMSLDKAVDRMVTQTWALARRQNAWFKRDRNVHWIEVTGRMADDVADTIVSRWRGERR